MRILVAYRAIHNTAGGVERMSSLIMNEMARRGHEVKFITLDATEAVSFYKLDDRIEWIKLGIGDPSQIAGFRTRWQRICATRRILKTFKPDVVLAFQEASFLTSLLAAIGLRIPVIAAERNSPSRFEFMDVAKRQLAFQSFRFAKFVTIQCESFRHYYPRRLHRKIETIPNPIFPIETSPSYKENFILSVGRLEYQKNFQALIKAFAKTASDFPDWKLVIVGEGQDRAVLEDMIAASGLNDRVSLPGSSQDLVSYYRQASIFALTSRWEGFPNALGEALAYGLPSAGFGDCDGVRDLIKNGENGLLAQGNDNFESLAEALAKLMRDEKLRDEMGKAAFQSIRPYEPSAIFDRWEQILKDAANG